MATLTLRVEDGVRDRLQSLADGNGVNVSDLLREAIDDLLGNGRDAPPTSAVPESISLVDRRQLVLLHRILARLVQDQTADVRLEYDGDTKYQLDRADVLEHGWTGEYNIEFIATEPEMSRRDCGTVMDILDMFRVIRSSVAELPETLVDDQAAVLKFHGFDSNDQREVRYLTYAHALIRDGKWTDLADVFSDAHDNGNSHAPLLSAYERMLAVFQPLWAEIVRRGGRRGFVLNAEELQQIANAAVHPENRRRRGGR